MALNEDDISNIVSAVIAGLESHASAPCPLQSDEKHISHHQTLEEMIKERSERLREEERSKQTTENVKAHVAGWGIVAMITGLGFMALSWLESLAKKLPFPPPN